MYTVLMLYPDYLTSDYPNETYLAWVEAKTPREAAAAARAEAVAEYPSLYGDVDPPDPIDFTIILLTPGKIRNYSEFHDEPVGGV